MTALFLVFVFIGLLLIGTPIFMTILGTSVVPGLADSSLGIGLSYLSRIFPTSNFSTVLLAMPMFCMSGVIMGVGGISERTFNVFHLIVGKWRAGIPIAVTLCACMYGAICGAGAPAAAAIGAMAIPMMIELGYAPTFAAGIVAAGGGIGLIIPPSVGYIMYGSLTGTSVGDLFKSGVVPGLVIGGCLIVFCIIYCTVKGEDKEKINAKYQELLERGVGKVLLDSIWALLAPVIILGGIYGGIFTPTEAACVSVWYALFVSFFIYKTVTPKELLKLLRDSVDSYAGLLAISAFSGGLTKVFTLLNIPKKIAEFMTSNFSNKWVALALVLFVLFLVGMFLDVLPCVIMVAPLLDPIRVTGYGFNAVHFGILLTATVALGLISPPYGLNLFVTTKIANVDVGSLYKQASLVTAVYVVAIIIISAFPVLSTFLL